MAIFAFAGIAYCQREGGHIRMDVVVGRFRGRVKWAAELVATIALVIIVSVLIYGSYHHFLRSFDFQSPLWSRDSSIDISIPLWPAKLVVPVALTLLWIRLIIQLVGFARALRAGSTRPVAVPLDLAPSDQSITEMAPLARRDE